ncbi:proton channel OtopLc-like isoform X2 [Scylla paramamosain]|uniref:proton channel OtopLc-like isoform X2 n=1 Tax=Scylla paramamosain TaxID=85552 RepID=UPI0030839DA1
MVQHHLYRNSRRNVQEKLHRQLSECDCNHPHHLHGRHHHDSADHHHHHHHHGSSGRGHHHHRSQSTRSSARPRHEPLRRHNTYGHEHYLKIRQELEERQEADSLEASAGREEEEEQGEEEHSAVRRVSHYRQEEKGLTDVERWVGVHGGVGEDGAEPSSNAAASANTPTTPHIIVSAEEDEVADNTTPKVRLTYDNEDQCDSSASNGQVTNNGVAATGINGGPNNEEKRPKLSLTMNSLELPDARRLSFDYGYKKTRRGSINEILRRMEGSQINLQLPTHHHMRRSSSKNSLEPSVMDWRQEGNDSLIACVSALYGKLLVVMGMAFPVAEVISHNIPISFYNGFYLYLYIGSIVFLVYAYLFLLQTINIPTSQIKSKFQTLRNYVPIPDLNLAFIRRRNSSNTNEGTGRLHSKESRFSGNDADKESDRASINTMTFKPPKYGLTESSNHGSMYLKMGAVLFGIGSMIYSGLEVGQYFELQGGDSCADILLVISPAARMLFTFIQMYFIFLNSRVAISRHRIIARFGLMHMIGTNLCIWLNVLVQETKHEIINLYFHGEHHGVRGTNLSTGAHGDSAVLGGHDHAVEHDNEDVHVPHLVERGDHGTPSNASHHKEPNITHAPAHHQSDHGQVFSIYECSRSELMGELVDKASPFLFPCTIEYSLLCAGVLYVVWNNINKPEVTRDGDSDISTYLARRVRHHYSVDCAHANRGLFMGILILVLTIISLILFFVLINNEAYKSLAIMEANIIELSVYGVATVTVVVGMIQMRELEFVPDGDIELDNILLLIAQTGVYIYTSFTIIGGHFTMSDARAVMVLPLLSAIITLTQTTLQTIFILDATRRCCYNSEQLERKPGREMVTFLLVCNLAMWAINTFETSRADAHPTQLNFYGIWAWTIISHISMPLAIFYRFHVTVCLCEIWKRSYKLKHEY